MNILTTPSSKQQQQTVSRSVNQLVHACMSRHASSAFWFNLKYGGQGPPHPKHPIHSTRCPALRKNGESKLLVPSNIQCVGRAWGPGHCSIECTEKVLSTRTSDRDETTPPSLPPCSLTDRPVTRKLKCRVPAKCSVHVAKRHRRTRTDVDKVDD